MKGRHERKLNKTTRMYLFTILLAVVVVSTWGTLAAYVSRSYVKGVATTPKQGFSLSSDYLSAVSKNAELNTYPDKKILLTEKEAGDESPYSFTFSITNTADGSVSTKRMQYYLAMSNLPQGTIVTYLQENITEKVTHKKTGEEEYDGYKAPVMNAYTRATHTYTITIPKDKMASAADITVTATPNADSDASGFILAGKLQPSIIGTVASFSYARVLLETGNIADYAAFNYQISVSNASEDQKMQLTWNNSKVEIDPLFLEKIGKQDGNSGSLELTMNDTNSSYLIQFYRLPGGNISDWRDLGLTFGLAP